jgi:RNA polymerase sigma-70 factor (ECF subfamily)
MFGSTQSNTRASGISVNSEASDAALIQSIADGDKAAFKLLYMRHRERVYRFVVRLSGSDSMADEAVNEVFLAVWRSAGKFEAKSKVATWLLAIARFKVLTESRRRSEVPLDERAAASIEDPTDDPATCIEKRQRSDILQRCLGKLTPSHRDVINLIYYQGKKIEEVARSSGTPAATVKTRLHYARNRLADLLSEAGVDRAWVAA